MGIHEIDLGAALLTAPVIQEPYPTYKALRETAPVYWSEGLGQWLVTGYDEVLEVYRSHDRFSNTNSQRNTVLFGALSDRILEKIPLVRHVEETPVLVSADPPAHTRHRQHVNPSLTPRRLAAMTGGIQTMCESLLASLATDASRDVVEHLSVPFAYHAILGLFGAPFRYQPVFSRVQEARRAFVRVGGGGSVAALKYEAALAAFVDALREIYDTVSRENGGGMIKMLLTEPVKGEILAPDELFGVLRIFLSAAQDNLISSIPTAMYALMTHPEQLELVRANPSLARDAFEEAMRWDVPVQGNFRVACVDTVLGGQEIRAGDRLINYKAAANRDPARFTDPDRFDLTRLADMNANHLAFGQGIHFCVGAGLARLEVPMMIAMLIQRFPRLRLACGWKPQYINSTTAHQLTDLRVVLR